MRPKLTKRQQQVFDVIRRHIDENGVSPSLRDMAGVLGFASRNSVANHLKALAKKGYVTWQPNRAGMLRIIDGS